MFRFWFQGWININCQLVLLLVLPRQFLNWPKRKEGTICSRGRPGQVSRRFKETNSHYIHNQLVVVLNCFLLCMMWWRGTLNFGRHFLEHQTTCVNASSLYRIRSLILRTNWQPHMSTNTAVVILTRAHTTTCAWCAAASMIFIHIFADYYAYVIYCFAQWA